MARVMRRKRDTRYASRVVSEILEGIIASFASFVLVFLLCAGLMALTSLVISIETGSAARTIRFIQIGWQLQLLGQFVAVRISGIPLSIAPLLMTLIEMGLISAFLTRRHPLRHTVILSGALAWLFFTLLVQWAFQADVTDPWYSQILKILFVYFLALVPRLVRQVGESFFKRGGVDSRICVLIKTGFRWARLIFWIVFAESAIIALLWIVRGWGSYSHICSILRMKSVSFALSIVFSFLWIPNLLVWAAIWAAGGTIHVGTLATYSLDAAKGSQLPLLPSLGWMPAAVDSTPLRAFLRALPWLIAVGATIAFALSSRGFRLVLTVRTVLASIRNDENTASSPYVRVIGRAMLGQLVPLLNGLVCLLVGTLAPVWLSDGSLGSHDLLFVGAPVKEALVHLTLPLLVAAAASWLLTGLACLLIVVLRAHGITVRMLGGRLAQILAPLFHRPDAQVQQQGQEPLANSNNPPDSEKTGEHKEQEENR